jgi:hypothetical protein
MGRKKTKKILCRKHSEGFERPPKSFYALISHGFAGCPHPTGGKWEFVGFRWLRDPYRAAGFLPKEYQKASLHRIFFPRGVSFSDFMLTFATSKKILLVMKSSTWVGESSVMASS